MSLFDKKQPREMCSMCGKTKAQVNKLIVGLHGAVCSDCHDLIGDILLKEPQRPEPPAVQSSSSGFDLRESVCMANHALPEAGLVTMHSGNASGYDPASGLVHIKPSGRDYGTITPHNLVAVNLHSGEALEGQLRPSVDLPHHLYLYRQMPEVGGIVHTHSNYATAFAACGLSIPPVLTAIADEFGGEIPCAPYVDNEGDNIGRAILAHKNERAPGILLAHHGVFTWGPTPEAALKAAVMIEDIAKTVWLAKQIGKPVPLPTAEVEKWWDRYQNRYGQ